MNWKRYFTSFTDVCKNIFWETQFLSLAEIALAWLLRWKWSLISTSLLCSLFFLAVNVILIGVIPVAEGEYKFRDILSTSTDYKWKTFSRSQSNKWKNYIMSYRSLYFDDFDDDDDGNLGSYDITEATVYKHSLWNKGSTSLMEPIENHIITLLCQKKGRPRLYLTLEKLYGVPKLNLLTILFGPVKQSGIYVQLAGSQDDALTATKGDNRPCLDVGRRRWRRKKNSKLRVEHLFIYYTQRSADLSGDYHIYSSNGRHFVDAIVYILQQMQDDDLGVDIKSTSDDSSFLYVLFQVIIRFIVN